MLDSISADHSLRSMVCTSAWGRAIGKLASAVAAGVRTETSCKRCEGRSICVGFVSNVSRCSSTSNAFPNGIHVGQLESLTFDGKHSRANVASSTVILFRLRPAVNMYQDEERLLVVAGFVVFQVEFVEVERGREGIIMGLLYLPVKQSMLIRKLVQNRSLGPGHSVLMRLPALELCGISQILFLLPTAT